jgi:hypothetical protein
MMKRLMLFALVALSVISSVRGTASAQLLPPDSVRCTSAYLLPTEIAQRRYAWALYCRSNQGHTAGGSLISAEKYLTQESIDFYNTDTNLTRRDNLFPVYLDFATGGSWDIPGSVLTTGTDWKALPTNPAVCRSTVDVPAGVFPPTAINAGLCVAGCYVEGTQLQFTDGTVDIKAALESGKVDLVTLSPTATLDNLQFANNKVQRYLTDLTEAVQDIYTLSMKSGGQLRVTGEHPLLTSDGVIHQAQSLKPGDQLILANGKPDPIVRIEFNKIFGKVYNVQPITTDYVSNIVVAGGYLNGSLRYQNEFLDMINALILRRALADEADKPTAH